MESHIFYSYYSFAFLIRLEMQQQQWKMDKIPNGKLHCWRNALHDEKFKIINFNTYLYVVFSAGAKEEFSVNRFGFHHLL